MSFALAIAWLIPCAAGVAVYAAFDARREPGYWPTAFGYGLVLGLLFAAAASDLFARADPAHAITRGWLPLTVFVLVVVVVAWWRSRARVPASATVPSRKMEKWKIALFCAALASLAWRAYIALREILLRPTFPWDAWDAWAVKSKAWFLLGHYAPFVSMGQWISGTSGESYSGPAWSYPAALAWLQVWFASAAGGWIEPLINLPWLALWVGMLLGHYGQWRALGLTRMRAMAFVYFLGSLPLITVHVALAGYADLWIATIFGFAILAWARWLEQRDRNQLALACLCVLSLPWIKLEGAVWMLIFAGVAGYCSLPRHGRRYVMAVFVAIVAIGALFGHLKVPLFGLGWVGISLHSIEVPVIGTLAIAFHPRAMAGAVASLFTQPNWQLLWYLAPIIAIWRWRQFRELRAARALGALLALSLVFLGFLFLFTDAARWAESYTAINRLVMHIVPALITLLALLLRDVDFSPALPGTAPRSVSRSHPA
jgi:hypothetical protein